MNRSVVQYILGLMISGSFPFVATAQITFEFQQGVNGYEGTSDTYFQSGNPERVRGSAQEWEWDGSDANGSNFGALRFDDIIGNDINQIPPNSAVIRAYLTLTVSNAGNQNEIGTVHNLLKPFSEAMPLVDFTTNSEPFPGDDYEEDIVAEIPGPAAGDVVEIDVSSSLQRWVSGEEYFGWMFVPDPAGTNGVGIQSSEINESGVPKLIITTPNRIFQFRDGMDGYEGTVDTFINSGTSSATINGSTDWIEWDGAENSGSSYGLLRFDDVFGDQPNQVPFGTYITRAQLYMTVQDAGSIGEFHEIHPGTESEPTNFDEISTTLATFGNGYEPRDGIDYADDVVEIIEGVRGLQKMDMTPTIQKYSDGAANLGWIIVPTGNNGVEVISSERADELVGGDPVKLTVIIDERITAIHEYSLY